MKIVVSCSALAASWIALPALAQDCPEGDWFCEPAADEAPPAEPGAAEAAKEPQAPDALQEPRSRIVVVRPELNEPPEPRRSRHVRRVRSRPEWGLDLHAFGALMGSGAASDAGMGGVGVGFRYRPLRHFALDGNLELAFGTDYNGFERREVAVLASAVGFVNPRSLVAVYGLGGVSLGGADVSNDGLAGTPLANDDETYGYFGMHLGAGAELRVSRHLAVHAEIIGFVRTRTDDDRDSQPEFIDPDTHRATNTSGGGLLRAGVMFYW